MVNVPVDSSRCHVTLSPHFPLSSAILSSGSIMAANANKNLFVLIILPIF